MWGCAHCSPRWLLVWLLPLPAMLAWWPFASPKARRTAPASFYAPGATPPLRSRHRWLRRLRSNRLETPAPAQGDPRRSSLSGPRTLPTVAPSCPLRGGVPVADSPCRRPPPRWSPAVRRHASFYAPRRDPTTPLTPPVVEEVAQQPSRNPRTRAGRHPKPVEPVKNRHSAYRRRLADRCAVASRRVADSPCRPTTSPVATRRTAPRLVLRSPAQPRHSAHATGG